MTEWEQRVAAVWGAADESTIVAQIDTLVAEPGVDAATAAFEAASARDFAGLESEAEPLYRRAWELGIAEPVRGQLVIQLASTLRNLGRYTEALDLLRAQFADVPEHPLAPAAEAFAALTLIDLDAPREAAIVALTALARTLPQYGNAVGRYTAELLD